MADDPSPAAEELKPQSDDTAGEPTAVPAGQAPPKRGRRGPYRPSHRATFIGLAVVVAILAINAGVIGFVLKSQSKNAAKASEGQVTINQSALDKLGVNRTVVGDSGIQLTVNPDAKFNGNLQVAGNASIAGELKLNSKFSAADASLTQLEAGKTSLSQLNVNGDGTLSNLNLRSDLIVAGTTHLQGSATFAQLVTVNNSLNVSGNLAVGGTLAVGAFQTSGLTVGGHVITAGLAPGVSRGSCTGSSGTVSISGNDTAGTVAVNTGVGACAGSLASVSFHSSYGSVPHVVVTAVGGAANVYISRSASGFTIYAGQALSPGGYAFDYIVEQ